MSTKDKLVKLAEHLMKWGSDLFDKEGPDELMPMFIAEDEKGARTVIMTPFSCDEEKIATAKTVRELFVEKNILRYAFLSEGWARIATPEEANGSKKIDPKVSGHEDRRECLTVIGTDGTTSVYMCRYILRPEHGKPCLTPVESSVTKQEHTRALFNNLLTV